jgi:hypothetical protein
MKLHGAKYHRLSSSFSLIFRIYYRYVFTADKNLLLENYSHYSYHTRRLGIQFFGISLNIYHIGNFVKFKFYIAIESALYVTF